PGVPHLPVAGRREHAGSERPIRPRRRDRQQRKPGHVLRGQVGRPGWGAAELLRHRGRLATSRVCVHGDGDRMTRARSQGGFTLVETLVAMAMTLVVFGATLTVLVVYNHGAQASTVRNDAADRARLTIDLIARQLRNIASPI